MAQMIIQPVAAPVPTHSFAEKPSPARDTLGTELEPDLDADLVVARVVEKPQPEIKVEDDFLTALRDGIAAGAQGLLAWPAQLISGAESLFWQGPPNALASARASAPISEADEPFPPITDEDAAELEVIIAALRSRAHYDAQSALAPRPSKGDRLSVIRSRKGDLILTAPIPRYGAALAAQPVSQVAVQSHTSDTAE